MTITITVTKEHLVRAYQATGEYCNICPLAQAFRDAGFPNALVGTTNGGYVVQLEDENSAWIPLPQEAAAIGEAYDFPSKRIRPMEDMLENPITFDVEVSAS